MGGGILSGLMWGTMTSVIVLGVVSQMAPLPPSALQDVAVVTPRAGDPVGKGAAPEAVGQVAGTPDAGVRDPAAERVARAAPDASGDTLPLPDSLSGIGPSRVAQGTGTQALPFPLADPGDNESTTQTASATSEPEAPADAEQGESPQLATSGDTGASPAVVAEQGEAIPVEPAAPALADAEPDVVAAPTGLTAAADVPSTAGPSQTVAEVAAGVPPVRLDAALAPDAVGSVDRPVNASSPSGPGRIDVAGLTPEAAEIADADALATAPAEVTAQITGAGAVQQGVQPEPVANELPVEIASARAQADLAASSETAPQVATSGGGTEIATQGIQTELVAQAPSEGTDSVNVEAHLQGSSGTAAARSETAELTVAALSEAPLPPTGQAEELVSATAERVAAAQGNAVADTADASDLLAGTATSTNLQADAGSEAVSTLEAELVAEAAPTTSTPASPAPTALAEESAAAELVASSGAEQAVAANDVTAEALTQETPVVTPQRVVQIDRPLVTISTERVTTTSITRTNTQTLDATLVASHTAIAEAATLSSSGVDAPAPSQPVAEALASGELSRSQGLAARTAITPDRPEVAALTRAAAEREVPEATVLPQPDAPAPTTTAEAEPDAVTESEAVLAATLPDADPEPSAPAAEEAPVRVAQAQLPQVRRNTGGTVGVRVQPLTDRSNDDNRPGRLVIGGNSGLNRASDAPAEPAPVAEATTQAAAEGATALERHAAPFENAQSLPKFSIVLIDAGVAGVDRQSLLDLQMPVTFAIDPSRPDAIEVAKGYREAGFEVILLAAGLPDQAQAQDVEVAFGTWTADIPEAVAIMDTQDGALAGNRVVAQQMAEALASDGHGLVLYDKGLNSAASAAEGVGVRTGLAFRQLDSRQERQPVIGRYLDRAAFKAAQEGAVIVVGHTYSDTVGALVKWTLEGRGKTMALAPISAVLRED